MMSNTVDNLDDSICAHFMFEGVFFKIRAQNTIAVDGQLPSSRNSSRRYNFLTIGFLKFKCNLVVHLILTRGSARAD